MSAKKHLVLDDDVHEVLKQRKELTGSSIKEIGNSVLRTSIESVFLGDIVGRILVEKHKLSEDEYNRALGQACAELRQSQANPRVPVETTSKGTLVVGSLEIKAALPTLRRRFSGVGMLDEGLPAASHAGTPAHGG